MASGLELWRMAAVRVSASFSGALIPNLISTVYYIELGVSEDIPQPLEHAFCIGRRIMVMNSHNIWELDGDSNQDQNITVAAGIYCYSSCAIHCRLRT